MNKEIMYQIVDLFMAGIPVAEIASAVKMTTLEVMTLLQEDEARTYADKLRELRRMELEALSDGPALNAVREGLTAGTTKERLQAADMSWRAAGKYSDSNDAVVTLAKVLEKVMSDVEDRRSV